MKVYVGLQYYDAEILEELLRIGPDGVVIGDILCDKRMFRHGDVEILDLLRYLNQKKVKVLYQTPMYVTDRVFGRITDNIGYYVEEKLICAVIVQDVGMTNYVKEHFSEIEIIWGRMGYARTPIINRSTIKFYKEIGISSFECKDVKECAIAKELGAVPYLLIGTPSYSTINRECYFKYEHNIFDSDCKRGCLKKEKMIIPMESPLETTIDGYILGYKNNYSKESIISAKDHDHIMIYAETISGIKSLYNEIIGDRL